MLRGFRSLSELVGSGQLLGSRQRQEDHYRISVLREIPGHPPTVLLVVSDGMGGQAGGAVAAELVVRACEAALSDSDDPRVMLEASLHAANAAVAAAAHSDAALADMGATLLAVLVMGDEFAWLSVGDSVLWHWDGERMRRLNADHSMREQLRDLMEMGRITREQYETDPRRSMLMSAVTGAEIPMIDRSNGSQRIEHGHILLLASDGIQTLDAASVEGHVRACDDASDLATRLLVAVEGARVRNQDNTTVVAYRHTAGDSVANRYRQSEAVTVRHHRVNSGTNKLPPKDCP